ncbi:MAG: aminotransferase class I/II-fold pyridoxal phosphate-dependent enzyme [Acidimicrobiales bacterium]
MTERPAAVVPPSGPHGGDGARVASALGVAVDQVLDLSASLNPAAPDPAPIVASVAAAAGRYPDVEAGEALLATHMDVDPARLVLTNGGSEAIALVAAELGSGHVVDPEFSLYARHLRLDPGAPRWRSNPNNPLGTLARPDDAAGVWDEAYWPLSTGTWTRGDAERGSWVLGSLTKLFACPGLRIGYVLAPDAIGAEAVRARRPRWSVSSLALAALPHLLERLDLAAWAHSVARSRQTLADALRARGAHVEVADAPWVLVHRAPDLRRRLAEHGVVVRDCRSFGLDGTVRIAVPDASGLDRLCHALDRLTIQDAPT